MSPWSTHGVTLDLCTGCGGIWLDGGELQCLVQRVQSDGGATQSRARGGGLDSVADVGEVLLQALELVAELASLF